MRINDMDNNIHIVYKMTKRSLDRNRLISIFREYLKSINSPQHPQFETYTDQELLKVAYLYRICITSDFFI